MEGNGERTAFCLWFSAFRSALSAPPRQKHAPNPHGVPGRQTPHQKFASRPATDRPLKTLSV
jgi:hypothetical protein